MLWGMLIPRLHSSLAVAFGLIHGLSIVTFPPPNSVIGIYA